jgi:hypothetical protein
MRRIASTLVPLAVLAALAPVPRVARASVGDQPETATMTITTDSRGFLHTTIGTGVPDTIDALQDGDVSVPLIGSIKNPIALDVVGINATAASVDGNPLGSVPPTLTPSIDHFQLGASTGFLLTIHVSGGTPGLYKVTFTVTDGGQPQTPMPDRSTWTEIGRLDTSPITGGPIYLQITTAAADFNSMSASTRMTVTLSGTQTLVKAMAAQSPSTADALPGSMSICCPGHFRMILHNSSNSATIQVTQGSGFVLLAPKDVIAIDVSTATDVVATVIDAATATLELGYP